MFHTNLVFMTADVDCDGTAYAAHRIQVPMHRAGELTNVSALAAFVRGQEIKYAGYVRDAYEVVTEQEFRSSDNFTTLDAWSKEYWNTEGYAHLHTDWAPWAHDDTIGITAFTQPHEVDPDGLIPMPGDRW